MAKKYMKVERTRCRFCREKLLVDYKDLGSMLKLSSPQGKIFSRKRSGNCAKHQKQVQVAFKQARFIGFLPYVG